MAAQRTVELIQLVLGRSVKMTNYWWSTGVLCTVLQQWV